MLLTLVLVFSMVACAKTETEETPAATESTGARPDYPSGVWVELTEKNPEEPLKLAFLAYKNNSWWNLVAGGEERAANYLKENCNTTVDYIIMGETQDTQTANNALETMLASDYDGVCFVSFNTGHVSYIDALVDAGIPVVTLYSEDTPPSDKRTMFIGTDAAGIAEAAVAVLEDWMADGGQYGIITSTFTATVAEIRRQTCEDKLGALGCELVGCFEASDSAATTYDYAIDMLTANPDIKAIYCCAGGEYGAARAVEELGMTDQVLVVGHNLTEDSFEYVDHGSLTIVGYNSMEVAENGLFTLYNKIVADIDPEVDVFKYGKDNCYVVTKDNVDEMREMLGYK
ncbi:MAG: sugar ABC transporter substrate-binding protein [Oscillospiraceae bacterium]|nr:sugar ABC transporter substrate-binding protein [Oscillospiraceae bacterium]